MLRYTCLYGGQSVGRPRAAARRGAARARPRRSARSERGKPSSRGVPRHMGPRLGAQLAATLHHPAPSRKVIRALGNLRNGLTFTARITFHDGAGWCSVAASCAPSLGPRCLGTPRDYFHLAFSFYKGVYIRRGRSASRVPQLPKRLHQTSTRCPANCRLRPTLLKPVRGVPSCRMPMQIAGAPSLCALPSLRCTLKSETQNLRAP